MEELLETERRLRVDYVSRAGSSCVPCGPGPWVWAPPVLGLSLALSVCEEATGRAGVGLALGRPG